MRTHRATFTAHGVMGDTRDFCAGNFALRARCKLRGELRASRSLQVVHYSKSQRSYLEFARMFAEDVYTWCFDKNRMNTIRFILQTRLLNVCAHTHG